MSKKSAINAVKILEEKRFLTVERSSDSCIKHNPNHYKVLPLPRIKKPERIDIHVPEPAFAQPF